MTDTPTPPTSIERPTRRAEWTQIGLSAAISAMVLIIICVLAWHSWPQDTSTQRIDWLGLQHAPIMRMGALAAVLAVAGLLYLGALFLSGMRPHHFRRAPAENTVGKTEA